MKTHFELERTNKPRQNLLFFHKFSSRIKKSNFFISVLEAKQHFNKLVYGLEISKLFLNYCLRNHIESYEFSNFGENSKKLKTDQINYFYADFGRLLLNKSVCLLAGHLSFNLRYNLDVED